MLLHHRRSFRLTLKGKSAQNQFFIGLRSFGGSRMPVKADFTDCRSVAVVVTAEILNAVGHFPHPITLQAFSLMALTIAHPADGAAPKNAIYQHYRFN